jgi:hypothetical protein
MVQESLMSRSDKVAVVETFLGCLASKDLAQLPIEPDLTVESPFITRVGGAPAMKYLKRVADSVRAIRVKQHIVEGDWVATLFDEDTPQGSVAVFARFEVVAERIREVSVFYDPRPLTKA